MTIVNKIYRLNEIEQQIAIIMNNISELERQQSIRQDWYMENTLGDDRGLIRDIKILKKEEKKQKAKLNKLRTEYNKIRAQLIKH
jgi:hypothetical protein